MSEQENAALLDRLEMHCLEGRFRYNQLCSSTPVLIRTNLSRLMYRLSTKGEASLTLPRSDPKAWLEEHVALGYTTPKEVLGV